MRSYNEWRLEGRTPLAGEHAQHFRVNADRTKAVAIFREDQTVPVQPDETVGGQIITAEEWQELKRTRSRDARRLAKVTFIDGRFQIWCGNNKVVIEHLKKNHWKFDPAAHRWCAKLDVDVSQVQAVLEKLGCRVEVEG